MDKREPPSTFTDELRKSLGATDDGISRFRKPWKLEGNPKAATPEEFNQAIE